MTIPAMAPPLRLLDEAFFDSEGVVKFNGFTRFCIQSKYELTLVKPLEK
jgi:hypothetical protein